MFAEKSTDGEKTELMALAARVDRQTTRRDFDPFIYSALHEELHLRLAECTRCAALFDAIARTSAINSAWFGAIRFSTPPAAIGDHKDLIKLLSMPRSARAAEAMRLHIRSSMENVMQGLEPYFQLHRRYKDTYSRSIRRPVAPYYKPGTAVANPVHPALSRVGSQRRIDPARVV